MYSQIKTTYKHHLSHVLPAKQSSFGLCCIQLNVCKSRFTLFYQNAIPQASHGEYSAHINHVKIDTFTVKVVQCYFGAS